MRVLIGCEFSGIVRDAFLARGHDAVSCDLLASETSGPHYQGDVRDICDDDCFDLFIAFPPCTHLCLSGNRWWRNSPEEDAAVEFVAYLMGSPIRRIAIENPIGVLSNRLRKPDQIIQPWQFGHGEVKATCLWLENLPPLHPTMIVAGRAPRVHRMAPSPTRWRERSRTYQGIADAMAAQWGAPGQQRPSW